MADRPKNEGRTGKSAAPQTTNLNFNDAILGTTWLSESGVLWVFDRSFEPDSERRSWEDLAYLLPPGIWKSGDEEIGIAVDPGLVTISICPWKGDHDQMAIIFAKCDPEDLWCVGPESLRGEIYRAYRPLDGVS